MNEDQKTKTIELSINLLRVLLFGDDRLEGITPRSKANGDTAKVIVIPFMVGNEIKKIDAEEEYFHVELFANDDGSARHAELWLAFEWKESNARRAKVQAYAAEHRVVRDRKRSRMDRIKERLGRLGLDKHPSYVEQLAKDILENYRKRDFSQTLKILHLAELLTEFEEEDKDGEK